MTLISTNVHSNTLQHQIWYVSTQIFLISSNVHNLHSKPLNHVFFKLKWPYYAQMYTSCIQPPQIRSSSTHMTLMPSNVHNLHSMQLHIKSSSTQMTLVHSNVHNFHSTPSNHILLNSNNLHYPERYTNALTWLKSPFKFHRTCIQISQVFKPPNVHLNISNAPNFQALTDAPNVHHCTSNTKHPKGSYKH